MVSNAYKEGVTHHRWAFLQIPHLTVQNARMLCLHQELPTRCDLQKILKYLIKEISKLSRTY